MNPRQRNRVTERLKASVKCLIALDERAKTAEAGMRYGELSQSLEPVALHLLESLKLLAAEPAE